jgi:predicted 3-demethylubiquinone-9 3-methyltransferase (glyoxalase superfamily)
MSLQILCETQEEVDYYWVRLTEGGEEGPCGWLKDRYGLSWQVTPIILYDMLNDLNPEKAQNVMNAMFRMKKIDTGALKRAYSGE